MKTLRYIGTALLAMVLCLNLTSCSDDDDDNGATEANLVGTWQYMAGEDWDKENGNIIDYDSFEDQDLRFTFNEDHTYTNDEKYSSDGLWHQAGSGTWKLVGNKIYLQGNGDEDSEYITIKKITSTDMVWEDHITYNEDGNTYEEYYHIELKKVNK